MKDLSYKIQYGIFRIFRAGLLLFPENIRFKIGEKVAVLGYYLIRSRRITTLANIQYAMPDKTKRKKKDCFGSLQNYGKSIFRNNLA